MQAIEPVLARPKTAHLLVIGFKAWAVPEEPESELALREQLAPSSTRAVWDLKGRPDARLAVTATEHATVRDALCALSEELGCNQLAALPRGPEEIGEISFMHPREEPPAIFFVTANLTVGVFSFGREFVDVVPFARRIDADLRSVPPEAREGGIAVEQVQNQIHATPRWRGPDGYLKVVAPGSELSKKGDTVDGVTGDADVYYIEPGRETYRVTVRRG
jgi:hypothetical protein